MAFARPVVSTPAAATDGPARAGFEGRVPGLHGVHERHPGLVGLQVLTRKAACAEQLDRPREVPGGSGRILLDFGPTRIAHPSGTASGRT